MIHEKKNQGNKAYAYGVNKIELLDQQPSNPNGVAMIRSELQSSSHDANLINNKQSPKISAEKLLEGVEKSYDPGVKLLDATEKITSDTNLTEDENALRAHTGKDFLDSGKQAEDRRPETMRSAWSYRFAEDEEDFNDIRERAISEKGLVMPGLAEKEVEIVSVPRHDFEGSSPISQAKNWAKKNLVDKEFNLVDSDGTLIEYSFSGKGIEKFLSHTSVDKSENLGIHLAVLKRLPQVIENSFEAEVHPDYKKGSDDVRRPENGIDNLNLLIHRLYGAVEIDGKIYRVKTTIKEILNDRNKPYNYEVAQIKMLDNEPSNSLELKEEKSSDFSNLQTANLTNNKGKGKLEGKELPYEVDKIELLDNEPSNSLASKERKENLSSSERAKLNNNSGTVKISSSELLKEVEKSYDPGVKLLDASEKITSDTNLTEDENALRAHTGKDFLDSCKQAEDTSTEAMRDSVQRLSERMNMPVRIIESLEDPDGEPLSRRERRSKGWFDKRTGEVTIVLPNNANVADVVATVVHEGWHKGLEHAFDTKEKRDEFLDFMYDNSSNKIKEEIDKETNRRINEEADRLRRQKSEQRRQEALNEGKSEREANDEVNAHYFEDQAAAYKEAHRNKAKYQRVSTDEFGARLSQKIGEGGFDKMSRDEQTLWGKIKTYLKRAFQNFLRGIGVTKPLNFTEKQWGAIAHEFFKMSLNGWSRKGTIFEEAERAAMERKSGLDRISELREGEETKSFRDREDTLISDVVRDLMDSAKRSNTDYKKMKDFFTVQWANSIVDGKEAFDISIRASRPEDSEEQKRLLDSLNDAANIINNFEREKLHCRSSF